MKKSFALLAFLLFSSPSFAVNDVYVIHLVLDGLRYDMLNKQVAEGSIPFLKQFFVDNGAVFDKAITTFPTVSSPGYISFATGLTAGNSGIFFLEWFDRTKKKPVGYLTAGGADRVNTDLLNQKLLRGTLGTEFVSPTTLFEQLKPAPTASLYTPFRKGASIAIPKKFPIKALFSGLIAKDGFALNKMAMEDLIKLFEKPLGEIPRYSLVALYGTDYYGHKKGPHSEEIHWDLKQFDHLFQQFAAKLKERGLDQKTYVVLSSDHGMHATGKHLKLKEILWSKGVRKNDKIYISNRGVSSTLIYAAGLEGWEEMPSLEHLRNFPTKKGKLVDLVEAIIEEEAVDLVAAREGMEKIRLFSKTGEALISLVQIGNDPFISYTVRGEDPLRYASHPTAQGLVNGKPYGISLWFQKTAATEYPNAVVELAHLFRDPRAGDLLVIAKEPWGFRTPKAGTHGSLDRSDMHIPLWIAGPGISKKRFGAAQSVDLYPTVLSWFGIEAPTLKSQEGKNLFASQPAPGSQRTADYLALLEREIMNHPSLYKAAQPGRLIQEMKQKYPQHVEADLLQKCKAELASRHQRWRVLKDFNDLHGKDKNKNWLLTKEQNIEFLRLRRMEDIKTILEHP